MAARQPPYYSPRVDTWALGSYGVDKICPDSSRARGVRELGFWDGRLSRWPAIHAQTKALGQNVRIPVLKYQRLCAARKIPVIFGVWSRKVT